MTFPFMSETCIFSLKEGVPTLFYCSKGFGFGLKIKFLKNIFQQYNPQVDKRNACSINLHCST